MTPDIRFVCWGNICRSPMAEVVARAHAEKAGLHGVTFSSAGVSAEEAGHPIDPRAAAALKAAGYTPGPFTAHQITVAEATSAALLIGMEELHLGWQVTDWGSAIWGGLIVSIVSFILNAFKQRGENHR